MFATFNCNRCFKVIREFPWDEERAIQLEPHISIKNSGGCWFWNWLTLQILHLCFANWNWRAVTLDLLSFFSWGFEIPEIEWILVVEIAILLSTIMNDHFRDSLTLSMKVERFENKVFHQRSSLFHYTKFSYSINVNFELEVERIVIHILRIKAVKLLEVSVTC